MKQIKIENNGVEQLITVPENSKVTIDGNVVVFETKFKKGDIIYYKEYDKNYGSTVGILDEDGSCIFSVNKKYCKEGLDTIGSKPCRLATNSEKQLLYDSLAKEGKQWNAEKMCIEDLKIVPKVGDCIRMDFTTGSHDYLVCGSNKSINITSKGNSFNTIRGIEKYMNYNSDCKYSLLTKQQFQSELSQLGFEYNFENDTISELKWKPKECETIYYFDYKLDIESDEYYEDCILYKSMYVNGNMFKTSELCQQAINKIKQVLKEK